MSRRGTDPIGSVAGCTKAVVLASSLIGTALLMALALTSPDYSSLAWISLLPLFWAIRSQGPTTAAFSGALWGISLYFFSTVGAAPAVAPTFFSLVLLATVPALYAGLGSLLTRAIGFNPLMLACGWILVEVALKPLRLHQGLLAGSLGDTAQLHWLARLLGYVFVALIVACANASLVSILSGTRLSFPACRSLAGSPNVVRRLASQSVLAIQPWTLRQVQARASPIAVTAPTWRVVGSAHRWRL